MKRIFLIGYMGSGKTSIGMKLADKLGFSFVDMDHMIEEKYLKTVSQIFAESGQDRFREIEKDVLHEVSEFDNVIIATGGGAPCFFDNIDYMNAHGLTVYLHLTAQQLAERLESSRTGKRPLLADRKGDELRQFITESLLQREVFYLKATLKVNGSDEDMIESITQSIEKQ
jgi:shikimate kinase